MFFSQSAVLAIVLAIASAVVAMPAPAGNTGTTATVNGVTYTNSRNGADVACTRGYDDWCAERRSDDDSDETTKDGLYFDTKVGDVADATVGVGAQEQDAGSSDADDVDVFPDTDETVDTSSTYPNATA